MLNRQKGLRHVAWLGLGVSLAAAQLATAKEAKPIVRQIASTSLVLSLDGSYNNRADSKQGAANTPYRRIAPANYGDGVSSLIDAPNARYISNRIFADKAQNLFSENGVTQWAYNWGQFIDHSIGLRALGDEPLEIYFDSHDPLELFSNSAQNLRATRSAADGTDLQGPREQLNTVSSYIDAWAVYGGSDSRIEWLREGPVDADLSNNGAKLLLTEDDYLPRASERRDAATAPVMERMGRLQAIPDADDQVIVAGDMRANENIALTAVQTLFAREHNRIVDQLPSDWSEQRRFDVARMLVIATQQYITYEEFLPALGVQLTRARGYKPKVDASVSNEFATVGYRAHSMIHGEIEVAVSSDHYDDGQLALFESQGIEVDAEDDAVELAVPLNVAFGNPQLVTQIGVGPIALGLAGEPQYKNDETIDNQLRSVLFQLPNEGIEDPDACLDGPTLNQCFSLVSDLGMLDIVRGRDHGMPYYNEMRKAYGLPRIESFTALTGEQTDQFPIGDPLIESEPAIDDPQIMDYVQLQDVDGGLVALDSEEAESEAVTGIRRSTLAARLRAIYGDVNRVEAFVGMVSEPHLPGSDMGALQHAMWRHEFESLRDGDANHYLWNWNLHRLSRTLKGLGLDWRQSLSDVVINNTNLDVSSVRSNLFLDETIELEEPGRGRGVHRRQK